ncbi:hypothetical protein JG688_00016539 [Phytophthora aleatoria]|uniref:Uncharacterized protein n=1 Tax=Phytophthora aleatoria TaxID=2496075 RepID=A0A8J5M1Z5_9STRA|nr:hypothetical protein JG688_00016539 [Phytophthora aleatoria]
MFGVELALLSDRERDVSQASSGRNAKLYELIELKNAVGDAFIGKRNASCGGKLFRIGGRLFLEGRAASKLDKVTRVKTTWYYYNKKTIARLKYGAADVPVHCLRPHHPYLCRP